MFERERRAYGEEVPIPTKPVVSTLIDSPPVPNDAEPPTSRLYAGVAVLIPTFPEDNTVIKVVVDVPPVVEETVKRGVLAVVFRLFEMDNTEDGVDEPMPTKPVL